MRSVASTGLICAVVLVLSAHAGIADLALAETNLASADSPGSLQGDPPLLDYCGWGAVTPFNRADGWIVAKGTTECVSGEFPYRKLRVRLQQEVQGDWVTRSTSFGVATPTEQYQLVKAPWPCKVDRWRSLVAVWYRWSEVDPWLVAHLHWHSPARDVRLCQPTVT